MRAIKVKTMGLTIVLVMNDVGEEVSVSQNDPAEREKAHAVKVT